MRASAGVGAGVVRRGNEACDHHVSCLVGLAVSCSCLVCLVKWVACAGSEKGRENGTGVCESVEDFRFDVLELGGPAVMGCARGDSA